MAFVSSEINLILSKKHHFNINQIGRELGHCFHDRLNGNFSFLSDKCLNETQPNIKKVLKTKFLETFSAKCDNYGLYSSSC
jgi:hypothetical protein